VGFTNHSKLLQDEMGYELVWESKNSEGKQEWKFKKGDVETEMNEDTISEYYIPSADKCKESMKKAHIKLTESIKKNLLILENNKEMDESYNIGGVPKGQQLLKDTFDWVLPRLPKRNVKNNS